MIKGLSEIIAKTEETQKLSSGNRIRRLTLGDGESALIRFLTDSDGVISARFHTTEEVMPDGRKRFRQMYCTNEEAGSCKYCAEGKQSRELLFLWAYVSYILHKSQNFRLEADPDAERWAMVKAGGKNVYKQIVNAPMIFRTGIGQRGSLKNMIIQYATDDGTLCGRDFIWSRSGTKLDTTYNLIGKDSKAATAEILEWNSKLPDLADYVTGKIYTMDESERSNNVIVSGEENVPESDNEEIKNLF